MSMLSPSQQRQLKRLEGHHAQQTKVHDELRQMLEDLQQTFGEQQAIIDMLSNKAGDDHREEITALSSRLERVKLGAQSSWTRLANLERELAESRASIEELTSKVQEIADQESTPGPRSVTAPPGAA